MKNHTSTHTIRINVFDEDDVALDTIELRCVFGVNFGEPESGRFGPVENYDPGSGDEFWVESVHRVQSDGVLREAAPHETAWAQTWLDNNEQHVADTVEVIEPPDERDACEDSAGLTNWGDEP